MVLKIGEEPVPGYRLVKFLGRGGFGQVWQATSPGGIHVALKLIDLSGREGLKEFKALRLMKSIRQANLTPILAFWLKDDEGFLVDEAQVGGDLATAGQAAISAPPMQGTVLMGSLSSMRPSELIIAMGLGDKTLSDRLRECQQMGLEGIPPEELFNYMLDAARAIDFLNTPRHDLGHGPVSPIQHCDIKPQNILIVGDTAQVCDFGLARELGANVKMTSAAVSPAYGAPELIEGQPPSSATDQYSLAITYVELRTGALPFADPDSYLHVVNAHLHGTLDLSGLTVEEQEIIRKATLRTPGERYESATRMVKSLRQACPEEFGSKRAMPAPRAHVPSSQTGSGIEATVAFPGATSGTDVGNPAERFPGTTETPSSRGFVTKLDPRKMASTRGYVAAEVVETRVRSKGRLLRVVKTIAVLGAVAVIAIVAWNFFRPSQLPADVLEIYEQARDELAKASAESDLYTKAELSSLVIDISKPYHEFKQFVSLRGEAEKLHEQARRESNTQALALITSAEKTADRMPPNPAELEQALADFQKAAKLASVQKETTPTGFRAELGAARAGAQLRESGVPDKRTVRELKGQRDTLLASGGEAAVSPLHRARLIVLGALSSKKDEPHEPLKAVNELRDLMRGPRDDPKALLKTLGGNSWEDQQIRSLADWAKKADPAIHQSVDRVLEGLQLVDTVSILAEAKRHYDDAIQARGPERVQKLKSLLNNLQGAKTSTLTGEQQQQFEALGQLAVLVDEAKTREQIEAACDWFAKAFDQGGGALIPELSAALVDLADRKADSLDASIDLLKRAQLDPYPEAKGRLHALYVKRIERHVGEPAQMTDADAYFQSLNRLCDAARKLDPDDDFVKLALAESLAEINSDNPEVAAAQTKGLLSHMQVDEAHRLYAAYVRLLLRKITRGKPADNDRERDAAALDELAKSDSGVFGLAVPHRRQRLAELLVQGASDLRTARSAENEPLLRSILYPYGEDGEEIAKRAYKLLMASEKKDDPQFLAELALATWHQPHDGKEADRLAWIFKQLADKQQKLGADRWPVVYISPQTQPDNPSDMLAATEMRVELADAVLSAAERPQDNDVKLFDEQFLEPSIAGARKFAGNNAALKKKLARLYYHKSHMLRKYPDVAWAFGKLKEETDASDMAVRLDPGQPEYLVERGYARLSQRKFDDALEDAKAAIGKDKNFYEGHALQAKVLLRQGRESGDSQEAARTLERSIQAGKKAIELARSDATRFVCWLDLGTSYTEFANVVDPKYRSPEELLNKAIDAVEQAQRIDARSYKDWALTRLGNAYEDLAWLAKVSVNENYERAIEAFTEAIGERPDLPDPYVGRGRCYYKREAESRQAGKGYVDKAIADLMKAVSCDKNEQNASARFWLGKAYLYQARKAKDANPAEASAKCKEAERLLSKAVEVGKKQGSADTPIYTVAWVGSRLDDDSFSKETIRNQVNAQLNAADTDALGSKDYKNQLYLILGKSHEREGDLSDRNAQALTKVDAKRAKLAERNSRWEKALDAYDAALGPDLAKADVFDVSLLKARARLRLDLPKSVTSCEQAARDADAVLRILGSKADADAYHVAGETHYELAKIMSAAAQTAAAKPQVIEQFKRAIDYFEQMIPKAIDDTDSYDAFLGHAMAIKLMIANDPGLVATWKPKAQKSINRALQLAAQGSTKAYLRTVKDQIDKLQ